MVFHLELIETDEVLFLKLLTGVILEKYKKLRLQSKSFEVCWLSLHI